MVLRTIKEKLKLKIARLRYGNIISDNFVSIRIPTYNRLDLLCERAVASALKQTYTYTEIIIVGDHCTDGTEEFLKKSVISKIKFYNLPPRDEKEKALLKNPEIRWFMGPVRATNEATKRCTGNWIAHIDDDDIWTKDHIEVLLKFALENNYEFVSSALIREKYGKQEKVGAENGYGGCQTWLYKKYVADIFPYDKNCYKKKWNKVSDIDVAERMKKAGVRMGYLDKVTAYVLPRPGEETIGLEAYKKYNANAIH